MSEYNLNTPEFVFLSQSVHYSLTHFQKQQKNISSDNSKESEKNIARSIRLSRSATTNESWSGWTILGQDPSSIKVYIEISFVVFV